jgi:hypothetical protein
MIVATWVYEILNSSGLGGADDSKYTGELDYVPLTRTSPASEYWGIDQSITYSDSDIMPDTAGIVDTVSSLPSFTDFQVNKLTSLL